MNVWSIRPLGAVLSVLDSKRKAHHKKRTVSPAASLTAQQAGTSSIMYKSDISMKARSYSARMGQMVLGEDTAFVAVRQYWVKTTLMSFDHIVDRGQWITLLS